MTKDNNSYTSEYFELLNFISRMQESALMQSDIILSEKKELEYKKRQHEYMIQEHEKNKIPNISMFSPLSTDDFFEEKTNDKDELQELNERLSQIEEDWNNHKKICNSFEQLKKFFSEHYSTSSNKNSDYSLKLLETQEMDRNRISRDLHDSTVQSLTSMGHKMEYCSKLIDIDPVRVKLELQSMIDFNKESINDMREIIYDLRPMSLNNIGFVSTVESFCQHLRRNEKINIYLKIEGRELDLSSIVSVTMYRIIQEACNNSLKHAHAKNLSIRIIFNENDINLFVEDDGVGFDIESVENRVKEDILHGFGLSTMKERARLLSGSFTIDTKPGAGTKIAVFVPIRCNIRKEEFHE